MFNKKIKDQNATLQAQLKEANEKIRQLTEWQRRALNGYPNGYPADMAAPNSDAPFVLPMVNAPIPVPEEQSSVNETREKRDIPLGSNGLVMEANNQEEIDFFKSFLKKDIRVLEFGSGISTAFIAPQVKELVSIENNLEWFDKTREMTKGIANVTLCLRPCNSEPTADYDDGTYENFADYVNFPKVFVFHNGLENINPEKQFDLVFIDGRARVACAEAAAKYYLKPGGMIIIHDIMHPNPQYRRFEYDKVLDFLHHVGGSFAMHAFKVKATNE